ncbi:MAG: hypothetical protein B6247_08415 [Candidatus Parabeggiatoa sp. nov. 2]|nr:MAG: hypothetical protein B6247_08415 [Beggiatoa sp. 4572_84]
MTANKKNVFCQAGSEKYVGMIFFHKHLILVVMTVNKKNVLSSWIIKRLRHDFFHKHLFLVVMTDNKNKVFCQAGSEKYVAMIFFHKHLIIPFSFFISIYGMYICG